MRRSEREITSREEIDGIIRDCQVCRLAFALDGEPYILPISFGYDGTALYFHTALEGRKIGFLQGSKRVCFQMERNVRLHRHGDQACRWSFSYESVIGFGAIRELTGRPEKTHALNHIMRHYSGRDWSFSEESLARTRLWTLPIETISGKKSVR